MLRAPEHTRQEVEKAYSEMPPVEYRPPADRWKNLPITASALGKGEGILRIVMLGDSIVNDTSRSRWDDLLRRDYARCRIDRTTCVRGGTGCWWYKEASRLKRYVLDLNPDLLIIGGISHKDDVNSIREVIRGVRQARPCDILLMTGAFGTIDPRDDAQWRPEIDPKGTDYRARLKRLADEEKAGFLDMTGAWGRCIRASGQDPNWFKRDPIHANIRGEQILGHILEAHLAPPVPPTRTIPEKPSVTHPRSLRKPPGRRATASLSHRIDRGIHDVGTLTAAYRQIITVYGPTHIHFDVEGIRGTRSAPPTMARKTLASRGTMPHADSYRPRRCCNLSTHSCGSRSIPE